MTDLTSGTNDDTARMTLEADAFHEAEDLSIDCPKCGATLGVMEIAETGRCDGTVQKEDIEGKGEVPTDDGCNAALSLELVWAS